jgi:hypothetical protein
MKTRMKVLIAAIAAATITTTTALAGPPEYIRCAESMTPAFTTEAQLHAYLVAVEHDNKINAGDYDTMSRHESEAQKILAQATYVALKGAVVKVIKVVNYGDCVPRGFLVCDPKTTNNQLEWVDGDDDFTEMDGTGIPYDY